MRTYTQKEPLATQGVLTLLRNSPLSSIHIHFGVELLVFAASLTSVSLSKNLFLDRLTGNAEYTAFPNFLSMSF